MEAKIREVPGESGFGLPVSPGRLSTTKEGWRFDQETQQTPPGPGVGHIRETQQTPPGPGVGHIRETQQTPPGPGVGHIRETQQTPPGPGVGHIRETQQTPPGPGVGHIRETQQTPPGPGVGHIRETQQTPPGPGVGHIRETQQIPPGPGVGHISSGATETALPPQDACQMGWTSYSPENTRQQNPRPGPRTRVARADAGTGDQGTGCLDTVREDEGDSRARWEPLGQRTPGSGGGLLVIGQGVAVPFTLRMGHGSSEVLPGLPDASEKGTAPQCPLEVGWEPAGSRQRPSRALRMAGGHGSLRPAWWTLSPALRERWPLGSLGPDSPTEARLHFRKWLPPAGGLGESSGPGSDSSVGFCQQKESNSVKCGKRFILSQRQVTLGRDPALRRA
ncbi:splicing factor, proline- and glutamine-rich [Pongo pygmaeus]|uniref:splicing factor, proline- and glutamine-rich n=1 Tax=Pongo pygmaeus TaxID=9600 RepID=UPI00300D73B2